MEEKKENDIYSKLVAQQEQDTLDKDQAILDHFGAANIAD
jgi:hypothetical protein